MPSWSCHFGFIVCFICVFWFCVVFGPFPVFRFLYCFLVVLISLLSLISLSLLPVFSAFPARQPRPCFECFCIDLCFSASLHLHLIPSLVLVVFKPVFSLLSLSVHSVWFTCVIHFRLFLCLSWFEFAFDYPSTWFLGFWIIPLFLNDAHLLFFNLYPECFLCESSPVLV